ncbi:MAG: thioredoxin domain-containing protein [Thaumarchaeota archaeon]|nr:thioredoxin domain-containing protein [Nitrososphaerota archaeon]
MVLCFIALGVFSVMGIFSAKYRRYAKEAFNCVIKKATLRKCDTDLDIKIKSEIVGSLMGVNKSLAAITNRHFEFLSWMFVLLTVASFAYSAYSVYNYVQYGNCNGPESTETCFLDPGATGAHGFSRAGEVTELAYPPSLAGHVIVNGSSRLTIIEYGCYSCPYTKKAEDAVNMLLSEYKDNITFIFKPMPVDKHPYASEAANAAECAAEQGNYLNYKTALFQNQHDFRTNGISSLKKLGIGLVENQTQFEDCIDSNKYQDTIAKFRDEGKSIGIFGTPTFFIGNRSFVGHIDYDVMKKIIEEELRK